MYRKHLERLLREFRLPKGLSKNIVAQKYTGALRLHIHTEMQVLSRIAVRELEGGYRFYCSKDHELPENENIKIFLGLQKVVATRRFWYGDAFVVRFSEHPKTYAYDVHDVPTTSIQLR